VKVFLEQEHLLRPPQLPNLSLKKSTRKVVVSLSASFDSVFSRLGFSGARFGCRAVLGLALFRIKDPYLFRVLF